MKRIYFHGETANWLRQRRGIQGDGELAVTTWSGRVDVGGGRVWLEHFRYGWVEVPADYDVDQLAALDPNTDTSCRRLSDREKGDMETAG